MNLILKYRIHTEGNIHIDTALFKTPEIEEYFHSEHKYDYNENTTLRDFILHCIKDAPLKGEQISQDIKTSLEKGWYENSFQIRFRGKLRSIICTEKVQLRLFLNYIDFIDSDILNLIWVLGDYGKGDVFRNEGEQIGVSFYFHSNESNHMYEPHVHVSEFGTDGELFVTLRPESASVKASRGRFDTKKQKKAIAFINAHLPEFIVFWNDMTNGIYVEPFMI